MENIIIAGRGKTSRANIEALMEDHYYANKNVKVIIAATDSMSDSLNWVHQHATDMKVDVQSDTGTDVIQRTFKTFKGTDTSVFLVWSDEDLDCQAAFVEARTYGFPVYDLTNGLYQIEGASDIPKVTVPKMPPEEVVDVDEELEDEELEDEDPLYAALEVLAEYIADAVVERLMEAKGRQ